MIRKDAYTTGEVAKLCNVTINTVVKWFESGVLKGYKLPKSGARRIKRTELLEFMRAHNIPTAAIEAEGIKVLVVDDDPNILKSFRRVFTKRKGYYLMEAKTGFEAGFIASKEKPDIIFLDIALPDLDGRQVIKMIRASEDLRDTKVVAITGVLDDAELKKLRRQGFNDYLKKPFRVSQVERRVRRQLGILS